MAVDDSADGVGMVRQRVTDAQGELRADGNVERVQLAHVACDERPRPAAVRADDQRAVVRPADPQPFVARRACDVLDDEPVVRTAGERELRHAQAGRERVAGRDPRRAELRLGRDEPQALHQLGEAQVPGAVVGDELDQPCHTNCSST